MRAPLEEPQGLVYRPEVVSVEEETALLDELESLRFDPIVMHGQAAKRTAGSTRSRRRISSATRSRSARSADGSAPREPPAAQATQTRSAAPSTPDADAQCAQQNMRPSDSMPCPMIRHPQ